ncbi:MAG TPA: hypothetical protein VNI02_22120 [Blastocatellia bacterium]|nr:hypothetical protein [Blastocatellia bacterium]
MINIFSIRCGLAFAPYLAESLADFLKDGRFASRVVRQAGCGLIIRSDEGVVLRLQHREAALGEAEAAHHSATIQFRRDSYDIKRLQDEVVIANVGASLLLSHPQSELWLEAAHVSQLLRTFGGLPVGEGESGPSSLPDWLNVSAGAGRLLISDQRNGRWVLLGKDHVEELERRLALLDDAGELPARYNPPTIPLKGLAIHLQSALRLTEALESFAETGGVEAFEEVTPTYSLTTGRSAEGIELRDFDRRVGLNSREARKYAGIIRAELERLNVAQVERGKTRTVFADDERGRWVLQWGDEILVPEDSLAELRSSHDIQPRAGRPRLMAERGGEFFLLLDTSTGACVALTKPEEERLARE